MLVSVSACSTGRPPRAVSTCWQRVVCVPNASVVVHVRVPPDGVWMRVVWCGPSHSARRRKHVEDRGYEARHQTTISLILRWMYARHALSACLAMASLAMKQAEPMSLPRMIAGLPLALR